MKSAPAAVVNFLNAGVKGICFDLYTITLQSGTVLRWTDADIDITDSGNTFVRGPALKRTRCKWARGIQVDTVTVDAENPNLMIGSLSLPMFAAAGGFEGATVQIDLAYFDLNATYIGALPKHFLGTVADVSPSRMGAKLVVKSGLGKLSQQMPTDTYQAACANNLYDSNCGANRASFTVAGTVSAVSAGSNPSITVTFASSVAASYFDLGSLAFTSGANSGVGRTVQTQTGSGTSVSIQFARPFPFAISVGDTLSASAGCDKTMTTCSDKFSRITFYRGTPFIPVVETAA